MLPGKHSKNIADARFGGFRSRLALRQQQGHEEPEWPRPGGRYVVSVDLHEVVTDLVGGKGDRVALVDRESIATIDDRAIQADPGTQDDARVGSLNAREERREALLRQLSYKDLRV